MRYLLIIFFASAIADKLDKTKTIPLPNYGSSGANAGLLPPHSESHTHDQGPQEYSFINKYESELNEDGYHYAYESSDGTNAEQEGRIIRGSKPEEGSLEVKGSFSYIGKDGQLYSVTYTADENGYQPTGDHLPTPPPIPVEILKSLQLSADRDGQYASMKSSYDADLYNL